MLKTMLPLCLMLSLISGCKQMSPENDSFCQLAHPIFFDKTDRVTEDTKREVEAHFLDWSTSLRMEEGNNETLIIMLIIAFIMLYLTACSADCCSFGHKQKLRIDCRFPTPKIRLRKGTPATSPSAPGPRWKSARNTSKTTAMPAHALHCHHRCMGDGRGYFTQRPAGLPPLNPHTPTTRREATASKHRQGIAGAGNEDRKMLRQISGIM